MAPIVTDNVNFHCRTKRVAPKDMPALWRDKAKKKLDDLSSHVGKLVFICEIGFRNSTDALYQPWDANSKASPDPQEQAGAYDAMLSNVIGDPHIGGIFAWGWNDVHRLTIKDQPAAQVLHKWFSAK